jgi:hypothetical protein
VEKSRSAGSKKSGAFGKHKGNIINKLMSREFFV